MLRRFILTIKLHNFTNRIRHLNYITPLLHLHIAIVIYHICIYHDLGPALMIPLLRLLCRYLFFNLALVYGKGAPRDISRGKKNR